VEKHSWESRLVQKKTWATLKYLVEDPENPCYIEYIDRIVRNLVAVQSRERLLEPDQVNAESSIKGIKVRQQTPTPLYAIPQAEILSVCPPPADHQEILRTLRNSDITLRSISYAKENCSDKLYNDVIEYTRAWTHNYRGKTSPETSLQISEPG